MFINRKGFTVVEIILTIVIIAVLGFAGWALWQSQQPASEEMSTNQSSRDNVPQQEESGLKKDEIIDLGNEPVDLVESKDAEKLPAKTPESFKKEISRTLKNNKPDENNCVDVYTVSKISAVNVAGSVASLDADTEESSQACGSGAGQVWYKTGEGQWDSLTVTQSVILCSTVEEKNIYEEFLDSCGDESKNEIVPNPNGSLKNSDA